MQKGIPWQPLWQAEFCATEAFISLHRMDVLKGIKFAGKFNTLLTSEILQFASARRNYVEIIRNKKNPSTKTDILTTAAAT